MDQETHNAEECQAKLVRYVMEHKSELDELKELVYQAQEKHHKAFVKQVIVMKSEEEFASELRREIMSIYMEREALVKGYIAVLVPAQKAWAEFDKKHRAGLDESLQDNYIHPGMGLLDEFAPDIRDDEATAKDRKKEWELENKIQ